MLKPYRAAVIGTACTMAAVVVTGLISLKDEQPNKDTSQALAMERSMTADKEQHEAGPILTLARAADIPVVILEVSAEVEEHQNTEPETEAQTEPLPEETAPAETIPEETEPETTEEIGRASCRERV